jgi:hypothetical protein
MDGYTDKGVFKPCKDCKTPVTCKLMGECKKAPMDG